MNIPDYISPIVGYRVWQWNATGLKSLNGEPWLPGRPLAAGCRAALGTIVGRAKPVHGAHESPRSKRIIARRLSSRCNSQVYHSGPRLRGANGCLVARELVFLNTSDDEVFAWLRLRT